MIREDAAQPERELAEMGTQQKCPPTSRLVRRRSDVHQVPVLPRVVPNPIRTAAAPERNQQRCQVIGQTPVVDPVLQQRMPHQNIENQLRRRTAEFPTREQRVERPWIIQDYVETQLAQPRFLSVARNL